MSDPSPINPIPPVVVALFLGLVGIELVLTLGQMGYIGGPQAVGWRISLQEQYGFSPTVWARITEGRWTDISLVRRLVTFPIVQGGFTEVAFAGALLLALGKFLSETFHVAAFLLVLLVSTVFGAVGFGIYGVAVGVNTPLTGAFSVVFGLIGAYTYTIWKNAKETGGNQLIAFRIVIVLMCLQLVWVGLGELIEGFRGRPTWVANLSAFAAGFAISTLAAPGGWTGFLRRIRG
jgi:membrane associated rhomboid family serine protease